MGRLLVRRLLFMAFVLWGVSLITFFLARVAPADPARLIAGAHANAAAIANVRAIYGLDQPLPVQYVHYLTGLLQGDLGTSFATRRPVASDLLAYLPATVELSVYALVIGSTLGIVLGAAAAKGASRRRVIVRHGLRNALLPAVTILGLEAALLAGGVFLVETIFAWPGVGRYAFDAILASDYNAIMGVTVTGAVIYVGINLIVDIAYLYLDPRIRYT